MSSSINPQNNRGLKVFCSSGPNLVVLAGTGQELLCGQAQNGVNFDFEVKFDLEGQGQRVVRMRNRWVATVAGLRHLLVLDGIGLSRMAKTIHTCP